MYAQLYSAHNTGETQRYRVFYYYFARFRSVTFGAYSALSFLLKVNVFDGNPLSKHTNMSISSKCKNDELSSKASKVALLRIRQEPFAIIKQDKKNYVEQSNVG